MSLIFPSHSSVDELEAVARTGQPIGAPLGGEG